MTITLGNLVMYQSFVNIFNTDPPGTTASRPTTHTIGFGFGFAENVLPKSTFCVSLDLGMAHEMLASVPMWLKLLRAPGSPSKW